MPEKPSSFYILVKNLRIFVYVKKFDLDDFGWFSQPKLMEKRWKKTRKNTKKEKNQPKSQILVDFFNQNPVKLEKKAKNHEKKIWLILVDFFSTKIMENNEKKLEKHKKGKKSTKITDFGWFFQPKSRKIRKKAKILKKKFGWFWLIFSTKIMEKRCINPGKTQKGKKSQILVDFFNQNPVKLEKRQKSWKNPPKSVILVDFNQPKSINK